MDAPRGRAEPTYCGCVDRPPRVLVVDDTDAVRDLIRTILELEGIEVFVAVDGQQALDTVAAIAPDVITMDVVMPRMDGLATAAALKARPDTAGIPIVMVSARARPVDRVRGAEAGVDTYLTKPFEPCDLLAAVRALLPAS